MIRIRLNIPFDRRVRFVLLTGALFLLTLEGWLLNQGRPTSAATDAVEAFVPASSGRHFYLTDANYATDVALTACASGYHMASLWEILDVSNLSYDYGHPDAHVKADSGNGPPSYWNGWVRTGQPSSGSSTAGTGNCRNWSSKLGTDRGVTVRLSRTWESAPGDIGPWDATSFGCGITGPVWCVGEFFVPLFTFEKDGDSLSKVGSVVTYNLRLTNTAGAGTPDLSCSITDPSIGIAISDTVSAGQSHLFTKTWTIPVGAPDPYVNTATATCSPVGFPNVGQAVAKHSIRLPRVYLPLITR